MFDLGRLLVVRVGNLKRCEVELQGVDVRLTTLCFIHAVRGASLKTPCQNLP